MQFGEIIRGGWKISQVWFIILLAFLAGLGNYGRDEIYEETTQNADVQEAFYETGFAQSIPDIDPLAILLAGGVIVGLIALWLVIATLSLIARGAIIYAASELDDGKRVTFMDALKTGFRYLWRLIASNILLYSPLIVLLLLFVAFIGIGAISNFDFGRNSALPSILIGMICLFFPILILIYLIQPFAHRGIVLKDLGVFESIRHGYRVMNKNLGYIFGLGLFFAVVGFLVGMANMAFSFMSWFGTIFIIVLGAKIGAFQSATFTLAYKEFAGIQRGFPVVVESSMAPDISTGSVSLTQD